MAKRKTPDELIGEVDPAELMEVSRKVLLHRAIEKARAGDIWMFVACQWPHLIIPENHPDAAFFPKVKINDTPELWVTLRIDHFQREIIESFFDGVHRECAIKGCTKPGKGWAVAIASNIWFDIYPDSRILITAPLADKARTGLYGELTATRNLMKMPGPGRKTNKELKDNERHYVQVLNPEQPEGFAGHHAAMVLFLFDESSGVADAFYEEAKKQARMICAISNPRVLTGWFHGLFDAPDPNKTQSIQTNFGKRKLVTVDGAEVMNVRHKRLEMAVAPEDVEIAGVKFEKHQPIPTEFYNAHCRLLIPSQLDYGRYVDICSEPNPRKVYVFGRGRFPKSDTDLQVIPLDYIRENINKDVPTEDFDVSAFGLDAAISKEGDKSVLAVGGLRGVVELHQTQKDSAKDIAMWVVEMAIHHGVDICAGGHPVCIDETGGYGKQVTPFLKAMGVRVIGVAANGSATRNKAEYFNMRSQLYGELRRRLDPSGRHRDEHWYLPNDTELHEELSCPEKIYTDGIRYKITPKDWRGTRSGSKTATKTVKGELGRSPDKADAVVHLYHAVAIQETRIDPSQRQLIYNVGEEKREAEALTFGEELDRHISGLAESMDRLYDERYSDEVWAYGA